MNERLVLRVVIDTDPRLSDPTRAIRASYISLQDAVESAGGEMVLGDEVMSTLVAGRPYYEPRFSDYEQIALIPAELVVGANEVTVTA
jgi:hypothetical protein